MTAGIVNLVRHGEVFNPDGIIYGRLPGFKLSDAGREMAVKTGAWLAARDVAVIVCSPLQRAVETATLIAEAMGTGLEITTDERLIESDSVFQGKRVSGPRDLLDPRLLRLMWNPLRPSWGEPFTEVADRMLAAAADAHAAAGEREAVCVSHQLPIWTARRRVDGKLLFHRPDRRECALASVTSIRFDAGDKPASTTYAEPAGSLGRRTGSPKPRQ